MSEMRLILLGCATAALTVTAPATARDNGSGGSGWHDGGGHHGGHRHSNPFSLYASADDVGRRGHGNGVVGGYGYGYGLDDRTFEPDSYNDWWHDRPSRAYPRWVQDNANCAPERMWWHGDTLRC